MKKVLFIFLILAMLLSPVKAVSNFNSTLSIDRLTFTVGKPLWISIYVKNLGDDIDSYNITKIEKVARDYNGNYVNPDVIVVSPSKTYIANVTPQEVRKVPIKVNVLYLLGDSKITFTVVSVENPNLDQELTLHLSSGIPESLPEFEGIHLLLSFMSCLLLFVMKLK